MIENLLQFQLDLSKFGKVTVPEEHAQLCKRIAVRLHQGIVAGSPENPKGNPVDTGWSRANWGVHVGRDDVPTKPMGSYPEGRTGPPMPANTFFKNVTSIKVVHYPFIWVYNNVPYIEALENGHSTQAPEGMVEQALHNVQTFLDTI